MPICNPIKRSAALLQSRYDSLLPRGTDRGKWSSSSVSVFWERVFVWVEIHRNTAGEVEQVHAHMCVCVPQFDPPQQDQNWVSSDFREQISR